jgi:glycosyltransferase involved in cell wall biosynthesis
MHVAYLINDYPAISHTFIRREINALEAQGVTVERFALRGWDNDLVDPRDIAELAKTQFTLKDGLGALLKTAAGFALRKPGPFMRGLKLALAMSKNSTRAWPYHLIYLAHACKILSWLDGRDITHLHAHFGTNPAEIAALVRVMGGPEFSFTAHGSEVFEEPKNHALPLKATHARAVVTSCAYIGSQMMYHIPHALWSKVNVVHCGLAASAFTGEPAPVPDKPVFLTVGRFSPEKGHLMLLEAFAGLRVSHPDAQLVLAGDGPMRAELESRIAKMGLKDAVRITGWVTSDQVREELRKARALVHPSFIEGLPVVIMEAMAEHRPVIATYIAGIPELVKDGTTGWLVPAGQVADLTDALKACADLSDKEIQALGDAGFERVRARHDVAVEAAKLKALFAQAPA